jgi:hypothetical protein
MVLDSSGCCVLRRLLRLAGQLHAYLGHADVRQAIAGVVAVAVRDPIGVCEGLQVADIVVAAIRSISLDSLHAGNRTVLLSTTNLAKDGVD